MTGMRFLWAVTSLPFRTRLIISAWGVFGWAIGAYVLVRYTTAVEPAKSTIEHWIFPMLLGLITYGSTVWLFVYHSARLAAQVEIEKAAQKIASYAGEDVSIVTAGATLCATRGYNRETTEKVIRRAQEIIAARATRQVVRSHPNLLNA